MKLDGYRKHGLVHCSRMAAYRVEDVTDICKVGDRVYVKVCRRVGRAFVCHFPVPPAKDITMCDKVCVALVYKYLVDVQGKK